MEIFEISFCFLFCSKYFLEIQLFNFVLFVFSAPEILRTHHLFSLSNKPSPSNYIPNSLLSNNSKKTGSPRYMAFLTFNIHSYHFCQNSSFDLQITFPSKQDNHQTFPYSFSKIMRYLHSSNQRKHSPVSIKILILTSVK